MAENVGGVKTSCLTMEVLGWKVLECLRRLLKALGLRLEVLKVLEVLRLCQNSLRLRLKILKSLEVLRLWLKVLGWRRYKGVRLSLEVVTLRLNDLCGSW